MFAPPPLIRSWVAVMVTCILLGGCSKTAETHLKDARTFVAAGDNASALIALKNALESQPNHAEARYLLGKTLLSSGDAIGAEIELTRARDGGHGPNAVVPQLAAAMVAQQHYAQVLTAFNALELDDASAHAELLTQLAIAHMGSGELAEAESKLDQALQLMPGHRSALETRSRLLAGTGRIDQALAIVDALLKDRPNAADLHVLRGDTLAYTGSSGAGRAVAAYQHALTLAPKLSSAHAGLIGTLLEQRRFDEARSQWKLLKQLHPQQLQTRFFEALLALHDGDSVLATEIAQGLLQRSPDSSRLQYLAGLAAEQSGALGGAETHFTKSLSLAPEALAPRRALAALHLRRGQATRGYEVLRPALAVSDPDSEVLLLAGMALLMAGDTAAASGFFTRAQAATPADQRARTGQALVQIERGRAADGIAALEAIAKSDATALADLPLITAHLRRDDRASALAAIDRLSAKQPGRPLADLLRARIALQSRDTPSARRAFEAALAKDSALLPALTGLGELDIAEKQPARAVERLRLALKQNPASIPLRVALADFVGRTGGAKAEVVKLMTEAIKGRPDDAGIRCALIDYALALGDNTLALTTAQSAAVVLPDHPDVLDRLGAAQLATGEPEQAKVSFGKLSALQPRAAGPLLRLMSVHATLNQHGRAWADARRALELAPGSMQVHKLAAVAAVRADKGGEALAIARAAAKLPGQQAAALQLEGEVELARRQPEAAVVALRKALDRQPSSEIATLLHEALLKAHGSQPAQQFAQSWLQAHHNDAAFLLYLGITAQNAGRLAEAEQAFRQILQGAPDHIEALNNLAQLMAMQKKDGAVAFAEKANRLAPNRPPVMDTLAFSYAASGRVDTALALQSQVVAISPDQPLFRLTLAKIQLQSGDKSAARETLVKLSKLAGFSHRDEVEQLLKRAGG